MEFEWDSTKAKSNLERRGVTRNADRDTSQRTEETNLRQTSTPYPSMTNFNEDTHFRLRAAIPGFRQCMFSRVALHSFGRRSSQKRETPCTLLGDAVHKNGRRSNANNLIIPWFACSYIPTLSGDALHSFVRRMHRNGRYAALLREIGCTSLGDDSTRIR